jgi:hypothetical protein
MIQRAKERAAFQEGAIDVAVLSIIEKHLEVVINDPNVIDVDFQGFFKIDDLPNPGPTVEITFMYLMMYSTSAPSRPHSK